MIQMTDHYGDMSEFYCVWASTTNKDRKSNLFYGSHDLFKFLSQL